MEVYTLDTMLRRAQVIDDFESLIWTERFAEVGDFEMVVHNSPAVRQLLVPGLRLACNESYRGMILENVEKTTSADGKSSIKVTGSSFETLLKDRVAMDALGGLDTQEKWVLSGTPGNVARQIFNDICRDGQLSVYDKIPYLMPGTIFPADSIPEPSGSVNFGFDPMSVYDAIKQICDTYDLGFRIVRNFDTSQLYFNIFSGSDRTSRQTLVSPVIFSQELDNLQNTRSLTTTAATKNTAYVIGKTSSVVVYGAYVDPESEGFSRKVMVVKADDIDETNPVLLNAALVQRGVEELAKVRGLQAFDGEFNQNSYYKYNVHYRLGDLVELRSDDGLVSTMRVTEQIFSSDASGDLAYPTLATNSFIEPGTWLGWPTAQRWIDLGSTTWGDL